jgi:hypothetical protein
MRPDFVQELGPVVFAWQFRREPLQQFLDRSGGEAAPDGLTQTPHTYA